ncbi:MAG: hypothetical protein U0641_11425 [Anaerolineae bacterium]
MVNLVVALVSRLLNGSHHIYHRSMTAGKDVFSKAAKIVVKTRRLTLPDGDMDKLLLQHVIFSKLLLDSRQAVLGHRQIMLGSGQLNPTLGFRVGVDLDAFSNHGLTSV